MNRKDLGDLIFITVREKGKPLEFGQPSQITAELEAVLWPVLAQVWEDGLRAAMDWTIANKGGAGPINPYSEDS